MTAERLLAWFDRGHLLRPTAEVPNSVDLARALALLAGCGDVPPSAHAEELAQRIGPADHLVFALVDGLGDDLLQRMAPDSFLRRHQAGVLHSVFPSTTAAALTSFATLAWPAEHAVPAWHTWLPDARLTATVLPYVERFRETPLEQLGVDARTAFPLPAATPRFARDVMSVIPAAYVDSVYSRYSRGDTPARGYRELAQAMDLALQHVIGTRGPTHTYVYLAFVDATSHRFGPAAKETLAAATDADRALAHLHARLPAGARLVVSADHGHADVPPEVRYLMFRDDPLLATLEQPPHGESRVPMFRVRPDQHERFRDLFQERLGERFALLTTDEVDELRLLGPVPLAAETRRRIGDYLALAAGPDVVELVPEEHPREMRGYHAGLRPEEVRVPLVVA